MDGGAATNAVSEELVLMIMNFERENQVPADQSAIVSFEKWSNTDDEANGVSKGGLQIRGAVIFRVGFQGIGCSKRVERLFRFKILRKGCSTWPGLILGGPSLDPAPVGLGHVTSLAGHVFKTLGITVKREEEESVSSRLDSLCLLEESALPKLDKGEEKPLSGAQVERLSLPLAGWQSLPETPTFFLRRGKAVTMADAAEAAEAETVPPERVPKPEFERERKARAEQWMVWARKGEWEHVKPPPSVYAFVEESHFRSTDAHRVDVLGGNKKKGVFKGNMVAARRVGFAPSVGEGGDCKSAWHCTDACCLGGVS